MPRSKSNHPNFVKQTLEQTPAAKESFGISRTEQHHHQQQQQHHYNTTNCNTNTNSNYYWDKSETNMVRYSNSNSSVSSDYSRRSLQSNQHRPNSDIHSYHKSFSKISSNDSVGSQGASYHNDNQHRPYVSGRRNKNTSKNHKQKNRHHRHSSSRDSLSLGSLNSGSNKYYYEDERSVNSQTSYRGNQFRVGVHSSSSYNNRYAPTSPGDSSYTNSIASSVNSSSYLNHHADSYSQTYFSQSHSLMNATSGTGSSESYKNAYSYSTLSAPTLMSSSVSSGVIGSSATVASHSSDFLNSFDNSSRYSMSTTTLLPPNGSVSNKSIATSATHKHEWLIRMNKKLMECRVGSLDPTVIPVLAMMSGWAKHKSKEGATNVERIVYRIIDERNVGNTKVPNVNVKLFTSVVDAWAKVSILNNCLTPIRSLIIFLN